MAVEFEVMEIDCRVMRFDLFNERFNLGSPNGFI